MITLCKVILGIIIILMISCSFNSEIRTFTELRDASFDGQLQIVALDSTVYYVENFTYSDSSIKILGRKKKFNHEIEYEGELQFGDLSYIQTSENYFIPSAVFLGLNLFIIGNAASFLTEPTEIRPMIEITHPSGGGSGSCPYVYSFNGESYILEGEAFGAALGKALETQTGIILRNLKSEGDKLKIKISNERPETHYFNNISFVAIETDLEEQLYSNNKNSFSTVNSKTKIYRAYDNLNNEISNLLLEDDNNYWTSDLLSATTKADFEDQIFVDLNNINSTDSISFIISSINTEISNVVFAYLQTILGDEYVNFLLAAEKDEELIKILKEVLSRSALKIDVWDGQKWNYVDLIYPEANHVKFQKLVRLPVIKSQNNLMKLRLRSMCDVWKIDEISYGISKNTKFSVHKPELIIFSSEVSNNFDLIKEQDSEYLRLLPGQSIELEYKPKSSNEKKITYAITIGGYLYEWIIDKRVFADKNQIDLEVNSPKVILVKELLKNMDAILPLIYEKWKIIKKKYVLHDTQKLN